MEVSSPLKSRLVSAAAISKVFPTAVFHESLDGYAVSGFVIRYQKLFEFRDFCFGDDKKALSISYQPVVGENNGRAFVSIDENLCSHAIQTEVNANILCRTISSGNVGDGFFYDGLNGEWRNIGSASDGNRDTADSASVIEETLVDESGNMA